MSIDFIIPAKVTSERVPRKNWREFYDGKSLVDITIENLIAAGADPSRIHLSCECEATALPVATAHDINYLPRDRELTWNTTPLTEWIASICGQVPGDSDIAWCQVCDPLFDSYRECLEHWPTVKKQHDSLVVCYPWSGYLMTDSGQPIGWSFGEHHTPSQQLPRFWTMPFTFSILTREAIRKTRYHIGKRPYWYECDGSHVDIDTLLDFRSAQYLYDAEQ